MRVIAVFLVLLAASRPGPVRSQDCASSRRPLSHARTPDFKQLPRSSISNSKGLLYCKSKRERAFSRPYTVHRRCRGARQEIIVTQGSDDGASVKPTGDLRCKGHAIAIATIVPEKSRASCGVVVTFQKEPTKARATAKGATSTRWSKAFKSRGPSMATKQRTWVLTAMSKPAFASAYVCLTTPPLPPLSLSRHLLPQPELYTKVKQRTLLCSRAGRQASSISLISTTIYYSLAKAPPSPLSSKPCCADCWSST